MHLDGDARRFLVVLPQFLQTVGRRPLRPPDRDGLRRLLFGGAGAGLGRCRGWGLDLLAGESGNKEQADDGEMVSSDHEEIPFGVSGLTQN